MPLLRRPGLTKTCERTSAGFGASAAGLAGSAAALSAGFAAAPSAARFHRIRRAWRHPPPVCRLALLQRLSRLSRPGRPSAGLAGTHDEDEVAIEAGRQRRLRQRQHVVFLGQFDAHLHELARRQLAFGVGDLARTVTSRLAGSILGSMPRMLPANGISPPPNAQPHRLVDLQQRQLLFGNREVDPHRVQVLQGHHGGAGRQILAEVDFRDTHRAAERRRQLLLVEHRLQLVHLRGGGRCGCTAPCRAWLPDRRRAAAVRWRAPAPSGRTRHLRLRRFEIGALDGIVELQQDRPGRTFWLAWKRISLTMPAVSTVRSTPRTALTVPIASTPGVQLDGLTMVVDTVAAGGFMVAKYCLIPLSRRKLKPTMPPHTTASSSRIAVMMMKRFTNMSPRPETGISVNVGTLIRRQVPISNDGGLTVPSGRSCQFHIGSCDGKAPMKTRRANSRDKILAAAAEVAREAGPGSLSLDAVASRAGVSKGGLLYNFPTKAKLMQGLVEDYLRDFEQALESAASPTTAAKAGLRPISGFRPMIARSRSRRHRGSFRRSPRIPIS